MPFLWGLLLVYGGIAAYIWLIYAVTRAESVRVGAWLFTLAACLVATVLACL